MTSHHSAESEQGSREELGGKGTTARDGDGRYASILEHTEEMIHDRGYHAVSIRDIAGAAGITVSSLYYYVSSKEQILYDISVRTMRKLIDQTQSEIARLADESFTAQFAAAVRAGVIFHIRDQHAAGVVLNESRRLRGEQYRKVRKGLLKEYEHMFIDLISKGIDAGEFRNQDAVMLAYITLSALTRISVWYKPDGRLSPEEIADQYESSLTAMVTK